MRLDEMREERPEVHALLRRIKARHKELSNLYAQVSGESVYEEALHRFYHQSFKVYRVQDVTLRIVEALRSLGPEGFQFHPFFLEIVNAGQRKRFTLDCNARWVAEAAPIVTAFLHARAFLEFAVTYGHTLDEAPQPMPYGWAALTELYQL